MHQQVLLILDRTAIKRVRPLIEVRLQRRRGSAVTRKQPLVVSNSGQKLREFVPNKMLCSTSKVERERLWSSGRNVSNKMLFVSSKKMGETRLQQDALCRETLKRQERLQQDAAVQKSKYMRTSPTLRRQRKP